MAFVHLHNHSEFSALDGISRIKTMAATVAGLGQNAAAITDHGDLAGAWKWQASCLEAGIKPVIGCEFYMAIGSRFERNSEVVPNDDDTVADADEGKEKVKRYMHLTVLARNTTGWKNLLALHNKAEDSFWYKPRIDFDLLDEHGEGLIILTGCLGGPVAGPLARAGALSRAGDEDGANEFRTLARANLDRLINAAGRDHVFLEVMYHGIGAEAHAFREIRALATETGIPLVATNDCHYEHEEDHTSHDGFLAVGVQQALDDPTRFSFNGDDSYFLRSEDQMLNVLGNVKNSEAAQAWRDACAMTQTVADLCDDTVIPEPRMRLPKYPVPPGYADSATYLHELVRDGAKERYDAPLSTEVKDRLRTEEDIIVTMGFEDYFLIVRDVIMWARSDYTPQDWIRLNAGDTLDEDNRTKKAPILVGPGRGSAAGAAISYCLGIVGLDPLMYGLLFERFLEPGRKGMPDIDVDFEAARRHEVFQYFVHRWGKENVAHIGTFGMALSKAAIKDAARILKPSNGDFARGKELMRLGAKMANLVPTAGGKAYSIAKLEDTEDPSTEAFRLLVEESGQDAQDILSYAREFEGLTKSRSIHACGFIISPEPLDEMVPLRRQSHAATADPDAPRVICWDGGDCESMGLLKMDVLGIMNLDIAHEAMNAISRNHGIEMSLDSIPDPDNSPDDGVVRGAYNLLATGRTAGVFQAESSGMSRTFTSVVPETLNDICAVVALFRPGPLAAKMPESYAARKAGIEPVSYTAFTKDPVETKWIDSVLGADYGMAIYQETIMRLSTVVSGFDAAQRSRLRKAMGKKNQSEMDACYTLWMEGAPHQTIAGDGLTVISPVFSLETAQNLWDFIKGAAEYLFNKSHSAAYGLLAYWTAYLKAGWPVEYGAAILAVADKDEKRLTALSSLRDDGIAVTAPDVNVSLSSTSAVNGEVRIGLAEVKGVGAAGASIVAEREANGPFSSLHDLMTRVRTVNPDGVAQKLSVVAMQGLIEAGALDSLGPRLGHALILRAAMATDVRPVEAEWTSVERSTRQRARLGVSLGVHPMASMEDHLRNLPLNDYSGVYEPLDSISSTDGDGVVTGGVVSSWDEKAYSGGRRANFTLESATMTIRCVMWDSTLSGLRRRNQVPRVGDVIRVSGRVSVNTISVADDESGIEETITTKELKVSSAIPVSTDAVAEVRPPAAVIDFAAKYQQLRNVELPKPAKMKPATVSASVVTDGTDSGADTAPDNIITLDDHRSASGFAVISIRPRESGLMGKVIRGESAVRSRNRIISCPQLPEPGKSYLCVTPNGDRIVLLTSGGAYTAGEMDELLQKVGLDSARWKRLSSKSATTGEWFVLGSEADEADISAA